MSFLGIQTGERFDGDPDRLRTSGTFAEVRPAVYDPRRYIEENAEDASGDRSCTRVRGSCSTGSR
jgi:hypothetical protein